MLRQLFIAIYLSYKICLSVASWTATPCTLLDVRYTMYVIWCTLHHVRYLMYATPCTLLDVRYTMYVTWCTLLPARYPLYATPCTLLSVRYSLYATPCTLLPVRYSLYATCSRYSRYLYPQSRIIGSACACNWPNISMDNIRFGFTTLLKMLLNYPLNAMTNLNIWEKLLYSRWNNYFPLKICSNTANFNHKTCVHISIYLKVSLHHIL